MRRAIAMVWLAACGASTQRVAPVVSVTDLEPVELTPKPPPEPASTPSAPTQPTTDTTAPPATPPRPPEEPIVFGLLEGDVAVEEAWDRWRSDGAMTYDAVFEIALLANRGRPVLMADELVVIALSRAVELSGCEPERLGRIRLIANASLTSAHPPELDPDLRRLADMGPTECAQVSSTSRP